MDRRIAKIQDILKRGYFNRLPINDLKIEPEVRLWRTTLDFALVDLLKGESAFRNEVSATWSQLEEWFHVSSEDFMMVCELALLDNNKTYETMQKVISSVYD